MNNQTRLATAVVLLLMTLPASAGDVIRNFSGDDSTTTAEFKVDGPWLLDWRLDSDFDTLVALDIALIEAKTGRHVGRVLHTKYKGNGVKLFQEGGNYKLRVSSTLGRWRIRIEQITAAEAKLYTPRKSN